MKKEIREIRRERDSVKREKGVVKRESILMNRQLANLQKKNTDVQNEALRLRMEAKDLQLESVKGQCRQAETQHDLARESLKERTSELQSAQLFLNQADSLSGADIIGMVNALNAEILQGAALMAHSFDSMRGGLVPTAEAITQTTLSVGEDLAQVLSEQRDQIHFDSTLVQLALQVCLVRCCKRIVETWALKDDRAVKRIYEQIYKGG
ncbi:hypothetical protein H0H81_006723 [Sphagnurus paluster]|uniref:Uncharacterized protein n=1 Tax=Sphagnurus paluster TaxID=117069 RepID=A0A9P7GL20_9AGAR|nr:hypothetical protein H0H81_006723 [Sphagnurus paluster]